MDSSKSFLALLLLVRFGQWETPAGLKSLREHVGIFIPPASPLPHRVTMGWLYALLKETPPLFFSIFNFNFIFSLFFSLNYI